MRSIGMFLLGVGLLSCKPQTTNTETTKTNTAQPVSAPATKAAASVPASLPEKVTIVEKPASAPAARYDKPTERRLYVGRVEASELISKDLHPLYAVDGDPETAWGFTPGDASLKLPISTVEGATQVRLRVSLAGSGSRSPKKLTLTALPGKQSVSAELDASEDWEELTLDLTAPTSAPASKPTGEITVNALVLDFEGILQEKEKPDEEEYIPDWMNYFEVSEVEVFVTGLTKENPAFEKNKLDHIEIWKKGRAANRPKGKELPLADEYAESVLFEPKPKKTDEDDEEEYDGEGFTPEEINYEEAFGQLKKFLPSQSSEVIARAKLALSATDKEQTLLRVAMTSLRPYELPSGSVGGVNEYGDLDNMNVLGDSEELYFPRFEFGTLLLQDQLEIIDSKGKNPPTDCGKTDQTLFWRRTANTGATPNELIISSCFSIEEREGSYKYRVEQVLEYDAKGRLQLWVTPYSIQWFDWVDKENGSWLAGMVRALPSGVSRFIEVAQIEPFSDDLPWLVLASSKPLFDAETAKESSELKDKLVAAGFTEAEIFDSRKAKNLTCCYTVVTAGRYKTKQEAKDTIKKLKEKGFEAYTKQGW